MTTRRSRGSALFLGFAMFGAACAAPELTIPAEDTAATLPRGEPTSDINAEGGRSVDEPVAVVQLVEEECVNAARRCGTIRVPQVIGSLDQVSIAFDEFGRPDEGPTTVILATDRTTIPNPEDLGPDHIIVLGNRGVWPGQPRPSCDEWRYLDAGAPEEEFLAATGECIERISDTGIDLAGNNRTNRAADIDHALRALDVRGPVNVIAIGGRADVLAALPETIEIQRVVYVEPWFSGADPSVTRANDIAETVDAVWAACAESSDCALVGTVEEFWDDVAELDAAPLELAATELDPDPQPIDANRIINAISGASTEAAEAAHLPVIHAAIRARDGVILGSFLHNAGGSPDLGPYEIVCGRSNAQARDFDGLPAALRDDYVDEVRRFRDFCSVVLASGPEAKIDPHPGLSIVTLSTVLRDSAGDRIVEPTVGWPSTPCVLAAATAYFGGIVSTEGCETPLTFSTRTGTPQLSSATVDLGDGIVTIEVPADWADEGLGYWVRNADPADPTALDVYLWFSETAESALTEMISEWSLSAPTRSTRTVGGRNVLLARGVSAWNDEVTTILGVAEVDGQNVGVALDGPNDEIDQLIETVLVPLFTAPIVQN